MANIGKGKIWDIDMAQYPMIYVCNVMNYDESKDQHIASKLHCKKKSLGLV